MIFRKLEEFDMAEYDDPEDQIVPDKINAPKGTKIVCMNISANVGNRPYSICRQELIEGHVYVIEAWYDDLVKLIGEECWGYFPERFVLA